ncbi:MAG TPA: Smr/MutS family protein [Burkholderiaceae bacterium]|nr:Smr/MutS family protein [Burkholderiaceae bacterium]
MAGERLRRLGDLAGLRDRLAEREQARREDEAQARLREQREREESGNFLDAMDQLGVAPLGPNERVHHPPRRHAPHARSRARDDAAVLVESVSDEIDVERLLETDDALSYRRPGIGPDVVRKLRRGEWVIQSEIDLHGMRVDEARTALGSFLREMVKRGTRCLRIVHGKGLGSKDRVPILKAKVRGWLMQRDEVIAFCQARAAEGGAGALVVLLRPAGNGKG